MAVPSPVSKTSQPIKNENECENETWEATYRGGPHRSPAFVSGFVDLASFETCFFFCGAMQSLKESMRTNGTPPNCSRWTVLPPLPAPASLVRVRWRMPCRCFWGAQCCNAVAQGTERKGAASNILSLPSRQGLFQPRRNAFPDCSRCSASCSCFARCCRASPERGHGASCHLWGPI